MTQVVSIGSARIVAGELDLIALPRNGGFGKRLVVLASGVWGVPSDYLDLAVNPGTARNLRAVVDAGYAVVNVQLGGPTNFGKDACLTSFDALLTWAAANLPGVLTDRVILWGNSGGNSAALRIAADRPTKVAAVVGTQPLSDIEDVRTRNVLGLRSTVDAAWGVTYPTPIPTRGNPLLRGGDLAGLPYRAYASTGDTTVPVATVDALVAVIGPTASRVTAGSAEHGDGAPMSTDPHDLVGFLNTYAR